MKFENYSVVKCPMGISIKPNNGDSDLEVTLTIENDTLHVTLHAHDNDWCGSDHIASEARYPIKHYCECHAKFEDCGYQDCCR